MMFIYSDSNVHKKFLEGGGTGPLPSIPDQSLHLLEFDGINVHGNQCLHADLIF